MAAMQKLGVANLNAGNGLGLSKTEEDVPDQFPAGLRVLVVDDDMTCLKILDQMLRKCEYNVTVCPRATSALSILRERKSSFDLVISDVHMPDMDGFKLLELVGLEMDLPVIMMSADRRTEMVMKGIKHGACDYLIKPVRFEELKNIWQHVVRKKWNENKDHEQSGSLEDSDKHRRGTDEAEYTSSVNDANDCNWKSQKKKRDAKEEEDDGELENDDPSTSKKPRVVWSVELHQQFVNAVNQLGIDKAVPKRILELMNVPGLTRENVASHLQKFRLYLKRLSGVAQHQGALHSSMCGPVDSGTKVGPLSRLDIQSLAASGQIPPQTLAALHAELLGRPSTGMVLPGLEQPVILQPSLQGPKCIPVDHREVTFGKPLMKCPSSMSKHFQPAGITVEDMSPSGFGSWVPSHLSPVGNASIGGLNGPQNGNMLVQMLQQQQQQQPPPQPLPSLAEASHLPMNVQSSCLVSPSPPPAGFQIGNNPFSIGQNAAVLLRSQMSKGLQAGGGAATINQTHPGYGGPAMDHMLLPQSNALPVGVGQVVAEGDLKTAVMQSGYFHGSPVPPAAMSAAGSSPCDGWRGSALSMNPAGRLAGLVPSLGDAHGPARATAALGGAAESQGRNLGFVGKDTGIIPSRFAADDVEPPPPPALNHNRVGGSGDTGRAQEELHLGFMEAPKVANPGLPHFSPADVMSVLSK